MPLPQYGWLGIFLLFGLLVVRIGWYLRRIFREDASWSWDSVKGAIILTRVVKTPAEGDDTEYTAAPVGEPYSGPRKVELTWEYVVAGTRYINKRFFPGDTLWGGPVLTQEEHRHLLSRYYQFAEVTVYYDPSNPQASTLWQGIQKDTVNRFLESLFILLAFSVGLYFMHPHFSP